jgi:hypothetical protein
MRYAYIQSESSTVSLGLATVIVMNAEYKRHNQIWQVLKPKLDIRLGTMVSLAGARPLASVGVPQSLDWPPAIMDPAAVAHGIRELASPLSE